MTVIVWDGKTLAADKQTTMFGQKVKGTKISKWNGHLIGGAGSSVLNEAMEKWYKEGAVIEFFPESITIDGDEDAYMIVIKPDGTILYYEDSPYALDFTENGKLAIGCGAPYAYGAMAMGADAVKAVEITIENNADCGMGIDTLTLD